MKLLTTILFFLGAFFTDSYGQAKRILIIASNRDSVGNNISGTFLMEIAYPFNHFTKSGYEVDVLTPKGGKTAIYDNGNVAADLSVIQKSELFMQKTSASLSPQQVKFSDYVAVFYPGGHGQYFDVMNDERIASITAMIYENGGVVATAGHGAASLINVRLSNNRWLVENKRMTCFPLWAEKKFMNISNYGKLLPFDMQEVLARRGADLVVCTPETRPNKDYTNIADAKNRIVTGAFATSAQWVAEETVNLIKK